MSVKFERVKEGMTLWTTLDRRMGATEMITVECVARTVIAVDQENRRLTITGSYGPKTISEKRLRDYYVECPLIIYNSMGRGRRARAEEKILWRQGKLTEVTNKPTKGKEAQND